MVARRLLDLGDRVALRKFVMDLPPQLSSVVDRIGRLATGGGLWMGFAAALAVIGPRARRAARAGLVAYAASSAITDGPVKWASQRDRPRGVLLADLPAAVGALVLRRYLRRIPPTPQRSPSRPPSSCPRLRRCSRQLRAWWRCSACKPCAITPPK
jgi:hypothetical protein